MNDPATGQRRRPFPSTPPAAPPPRGCLEGRRPVFRSSLAGVLLACAVAFGGAAGDKLAAEEVAAERSEPSPTAAGDRLVDEYFRIQTEALSRETLAGIDSLQEWESRKPEYRRQLAEMLGLDPMPERTPLEATVVGEIERDDFRVERLHFQPVPGLYVAANLYLPKRADEPLPAILYVCGHANVIEDGVRMGNKTAYQHHGAWFARHGYVCLVVDTIQRGEFEGIHHGTYRHRMWWWNNRGYTPAGVEAWTGIRALDYLQSREEVDPERLGITGRSGGGVYSWWIAALDERVTAAVPVAGITTLHNHVVDGCVEGHCDCMFQINTYRWDYPLVAALVAPRPLLISNSDKDAIFPLDGVVELHGKVRRIYELYDAGDRLGLQITEGPHRDTQELRVHAFRWMNRFLKDDESLIRQPAEKFFRPQELRVFETLPEDERVTTIQESFVPAVDATELPETFEALARQSSQWMEQLQAKTFRGWPSGEEVPPLDVQRLARRVFEDDGVRLTAYAFHSQRPYRLPMFVLEPTLQARETNEASATEGKTAVEVIVTDQAAWDRVAAGLAAALQRGETSSIESLRDASPDRERWQELVKRVRKSGRPLVLFAPRGVGPTEWSRDERERTHIRRRFMLLGQTADAMRVWDVRRLLQTLEQIQSLGGRPVTVSASGNAAGWALFASLFEEPVAELNLVDPPARNREGITLLNVSRIVEMPHVVLMAAQRGTRVRLAVEPESREPWDAVTSFPFRSSKAVTSSPAVSPRLARPRSVWLP